MFSYIKCSKTITLFLLLIDFSAKAQHISVSENYSAQQLVEDIFIGAGQDCLEVSNISVSGWIFAEGISYGYFNKENSNFYLEEGIILSTGRANSAVGPNNSLLSEGPISWGGDPDLEQALDISNTVNATVLEFDFIAQTNKISFDYVFSSEQYLTSITSPNQCNYTDGFAFLLKRVNGGEPYQNLAVIPNTDIPVKVNTVRGEGVCPAANQEYFGGFNPVQHPTNFNGQTVVMTAQSDIIPGELYHIKLVIADQGNNLYDSAVFLKGGSFNGNIDLGDDRLIATQNPLCIGETLMLNAFSEDVLSYQWLRNGEVINGETNATYEVTTEGTYEVQLTFAGGNCVLKGMITVEYSQNPTLNNVWLSQCETSGGETLFNLTQAESQLVANPQDFSFLYFLSENDAQHDQNPIANPESFALIAENQVVYVRVVNVFGCFLVAEISLSTTHNSLQNPDDLQACDDDFDGFAFFDLTQNSTNIEAQLPPGADYVFYANYEDALLGINSIENQQLENYQAENNQVVYVKITSNGECFGILWFTLVIPSFGEAVQDENLFLCEGESLMLAAPSGFLDYDWNINLTNPNTSYVFVSQPGTYTVSFKNDFGCVAVKTFFVTLSSKAEILSVEIDDFSQNGGSATVYVQGSGIYEFSLDGIHYQQSNVFTNLPVGQHLVFVRDVNGCGTTTELITVLNYPKFFTPNGDGINDFWRIPMLSMAYPEAQVEIFDRYGKLIFTFPAHSMGWDGTLHNNLLPSTDYWFVLHLNNRTVRGHFSLIR
ncbi:MAG: choice-of-anchor L domain-containing protein [Flavobacteriaceae bacterium]